MCDLEQCPECEAVQPVQQCTLGVLGPFAHFRCRYCGAMWTSHVDDLRARMGLDEDEPVALFDEFA